MLGVGSRAGYTHLCNHPVGLTPNRAVTSVTVSSLPFLAPRTASQTALKSTFQPGRPPGMLYSFLLGIVLIFIFCPLGPTLLWDSKTVRLYSPVAELAQRIFKKYFRLH